jgi:hypothetical protein
MLPKVDDVWELILPNGVVLEARISFCRLTKPFRQDLFRFLIKIQSDSAVVPALDCFGMPPMFRLEADTAEEARDVLRALGFQRSQINAMAESGGATC